MRIRELVDAIALLILALSSPQNDPDLLFKYDFKTPLTCRIDSSLISF